MENQILIPLNIPDVNVVSTELTIEGNFVITVKNTINGTQCHNCGQHADHYYDRARCIKLRHLSILGQNTYIHIFPKRYKCPHCGCMTTQICSWYLPRSPHTIAYENHVLLQLVMSQIEDVSIKEDLGYDAASGIVNRHIDKEVDWETIDNLELIGIDEISARKGHKDFLTIITTRVNGKIQILAVLKDRKKDTVAEFLSNIPKRLCKTIKAVCTDMYDGFINAVKENLPKRVKIIVDRFHVAKLYRGCVDDLRKSEMKRLKTELSADAYKELKNVMWILRKNPNEYTSEERQTLKKLFEYSPVLELTYQLSNELTKIFDENLKPQEAQQKLKNWEENVLLCELPCFDSFLSTLQKYKNYIINYFYDRHTSGFVEGINNKIKVPSL
jgi:transposase